MKLQNIRIVMVGTTHPGNVGAAARAMHNMGISRLALADPQCSIDEVAHARASGANIVLDECQIFGGLAAAVADCQRVIATSARRRTLAWPELDPAALAQELFELPDGCEVALVFGREHSGLNNDELQLCNQVVCIPTNPEFSSLNVASAIQILCYEIYRSQCEQPEARPLAEQDQLASSAEIEGFFEHMRESLECSGFIHPRQPGQIMQRLRRLYLRCGLTRNEVNILRGMLSAFRKRQG